jgi:hypothetical protein
MAPTIFDSAHKQIESAMAALTTLQNNKEGTSFVGRELAQVRKKLEEASLWLSQAENEQVIEEGESSNHK